MELNGKIINFLGDSITQGVGVDVPENIYLNVMKRECGLAAANNYGISGTRFARQRKPTDYAPSFDQDYISRVESMDKNADIVVVFGGTNDYGHGDATIGRRTDRTPYTFWGACHCLFTKLYETFPNAQIVVCTPLHCLGDENPHIKMSADGSVVDTPVLQTYVDIIREACDFYSIPVCDFHALAGIQPNIPLHQQTLCPDGLHPNAAGHKLMARCLTAFLERL